MRESDAGYLLQIVDETNIFPASQKRGHGILLSVADLKSDQATWFEGDGGLRNKPAIDVEPGWPGEECSGRLIVADLGMEGAAVGVGDVGRVADDRIEARGFVVECGEQIGLEKANAASDVMSMRVGGCDCESLRGDVERGDLRLREMNGESNCDGS